MFLKLDGLSKRFGDVPALAGLSVEIEEGEFFVLLGRSAAGKTTTLRTICGLETPDSGRVIFDGSDITQASPQSRGIALIFQSFALYPHLSVAENLAYPLRELRMGSADIARRVGETAEMLSITHTLARRPATLSGGEQQRVAIGRALIRRPRVLLLDEPLTNLDAKLRNDMRAEFKRLHRELGMTMVYATPDQLEAVTMAQRIAVIDEGRIISCDTPRALYRQPPNSEVATLVGSPPMNLLAGRVTGKNGGASAIALSFMDVPVAPNLRGQLSSDQPVIVGLRPHDLKPGSGRGKALHFDCRVHLVEPLGDVTIVDLKAGDDTLKMAVPEGAALKYQPGQTVPVEFDINALNLFQQATGERIN
ncbi:MAG: ABC transporter ATP-binding protein [Alphaproteobacteria bacterium]